MIRFSTILAEIPLRRLVFTIFIGTWIVRIFFLSAPDPLSIDEVSALSASEYGTASTFMTTANWAERWDIANHYRQWHILWIVPQLVLGYLFPGNGQIAYMTTYAFALIAMLALAGAARRLFGERGFLLCLLLSSVSPLFLNYTIRALGTMPATMCICLSLYLFCAPRWRLWTWIGGGLFLGLAFGISFGAGAAIVAITAGLGLSIVRNLFSEKIPVKEKIWQCCIYPMTGVMAALAPLVLIEIAARYAGGAYSEFLFRHTMLVLDAWLGPYGLWLRQLFELDPLLQVILIVVMAYAISSPLLSHWQKILLGITYGLIFILIAVAMEEATPRVFISLGLFTVVAAIVYVSRVLETSWLNTHSADNEIKRRESLHVPFDSRSLAIGILLIFIIFTSWRNLSNMPRLVFPSWPLLLLGLVALVLSVLSTSYYAVMRSVAILGTLFFLIGAGALYQAKSTHSRAQTYLLQHPYLKRVSYQNLWGYKAMTEVFDQMRLRASDPIRVIGPPATLYPASTYEEDPFKLQYYNYWLHRFKLDDVLTGEEIPYAFFFFEPSGPRPDSAPPPGTPEVPQQFRGVDTLGMFFSPRIHSYRGLELRFPKQKSSITPATMSALVVLPTEPKKQSTFGFEFLALAPYVPPGTRLRLSVFQGDLILGSTDAVVTSSKGKQADALISLYEPPRLQTESFRHIQVPILPKFEREEIRIEAQLYSPPNQPAPPLSLYIRRPYIDSL